MPTGTVKWYNPTKGFGFITPDDGSADIFVHHSAIKASGLSALQEGQRVYYDSFPNPKGASASNVSLVQ